MAGIFGLFDYTKEGPGVYPDDPPKGAFGTFFSVLGRKFWKIVTINLMYVVFSLPVFLIAFFGASFVIQAFVPGMTPQILADIFKDAGIILQEDITFLDFANLQFLQMYVLVAVTLVGLGLAIIGPVHAGVVYLLRNYAREEHAFVWMDFKDHARNNLRQSLATSAISFLLTLLFVINYSFYNTNMVLNSPLISVFLQTLIVVFFVIWCMMQLYLYPMMVTFKLTVKQLLRNSLMFAILRLPLNIGILLLSVLILFAIPGVLLLLGYGISVLAAMFWYLFFALAFNLFMTTFFAYRGLDKHMIQRIKAAEAPEQAEQAVEEDWEDDEDEAEEETEKEAGEAAEPGLSRSPYGSR